MPTPPAGVTGAIRRAGAAMWSYFLAVTCALLLLPAHAWADAKQKVAALSPSALVLVMDANGNELVAQNAGKPFVPASVAKIVTAWLAMEVLGPSSLPFASITSTSAEGESAATFCLASAQA